VILVNLSGRGDKDVESVLEYAGGGGGEAGVEDPARRRRQREGGA